MERVLIVGGSGFVGRAAMDCLTPLGHQVVYASRRPIPHYDGPACFRELDLLSGGDFDRVMREIAPTTLLHFGWTTETGAYWKSARNLDWVAATLAMTTAFVRAGGRRMVVAGTCAEYDWNEPRLDERVSRLAPATPYGQAKASLFQLLEAFAPELPLSFAWGRIFFPFGPHEKPDRLIPVIVNGLLSRKPVPLTEGTQVLDFMHVSDVGRAFAELALSNVQGAVNVASGVPRSIRSVALDFGRLLDGVDLLRFGAQPQRPGPIPHMDVSVDRLTDEVGFSPSLDWSAAIEDTTAWWRASALPQG